MYDLIIPDGKLYNPSTRQFRSVKGGTIKLEHSLLSLSKWEEITEKPFLKPGYKMTEEESILYIKCMTINHNVSDDLYKLITPNDIASISKYITKKATATTFSEDQNKRPNRRILTAEVIYAWMIILEIPKEFERWHLNRLFALIEAVSIEKSPKKKMSHQEAIRRYDKINEARRKALHSKG